MLFSPRKMKAIRIVGVVLFVLVFALGAVGCWDPTWGIPEPWEPM